MTQTTTASRKCPPGTLDLPRSQADASSLDLRALPVPQLAHQPCETCYLQRRDDAPCPDCLGERRVLVPVLCQDCEAPLLVGERGSCRACVAEAYEEIVAKVAPRRAVLAYTAVLAEPTRRAVA